MNKPLSYTQGKPAIFGGTPLFKKTLAIIKPSLFGLTKIISQMRKVFLSGNITTAEYVKRFEDKCADYLGVKHAVAVSSATSGLMLAVKGLGLKGEVIVPSFTFAATVHSLVWNKIKPVFVDCEEGTYDIDIRKIEEKITSETSAIMPVYLFGNPPKIKELQDIAKKNKLRLIFDSAQGFGAQYQGIKAGGFGDCEVFSLSPTKVLTTFEGGLVTTNNEKLAEFLRKARDYGKSEDEGDIDFIGLSARMSEVHALIGLKNLENLENCLKVRRKLIELYKSLLGSIEGINFQKVLSGNKTSGNYMVIFIESESFGMSRDSLHDALGAENIQTKEYFYPPVHLQKAYSQLRAEYEGNLPVTERAASRGLALPLYGHMQEDTVKKVCLAIKRIHRCKTPIQSQR